MVKDFMNMQGRELKLNALQASCQIYSIELLDDRNKLMAKPFHSVFELHVVKELIFVL